jgi:hypothetical protein
MDREEFSLGVEPISSIEAKTLDGFLEKLIPMPPKEKKSDAIKVATLPRSHGEDCKIVCVGEKMVSVSFDEELMDSENVWVTRIASTYVKSVKLTTRGYYDADEFETDAAGKMKPLSRSDEKLLIEHLAKTDRACINNDERDGEKPIARLVVGAFYSAKNGVVYENPDRKKNTPLRKVAGPKAEPK